MRSWAKMTFIVYFYQCGTLTKRDTYPRCFFFTEIQSWFWYKLCICMAFVFISTRPFYTVITMLMQYKNVRDHELFKKTFSFTVIKWVILIPQFNSVKCRWPERDWANTSTMQVAWPRKNLWICFLFLSKLDWTEITSSLWSRPAVLRKSSQTNRKCHQLKILL